MTQKDEDVWPTVRPEDLWIYDKLILSRMLGYECGPPGVSVPRPGNYIVRPITNLHGMGISAEIVHIRDRTDDLPVGHFWCQVFEGRHLSVDYMNGNQVLCVEGHRSSRELYKWDRWATVDDCVPLPTLLTDIASRYTTINCEFIGSKLIEVHLRNNPDFETLHDSIDVVWDGQSTIAPPGKQFVENRDYKRLGFFVPIS